MLSCIKDCTVVLRDPSVAKVHLGEGQLEAICLGHLVKPMVGLVWPKVDFLLEQSSPGDHWRTPQCAAGEEEHDLSSWGL